LSSNRIEKIALKAFEALLQLRVFDISNNKLKTFTLDMFGGTKFTGNKLRKLNLSSNKLMALDSSLLQILRNLISLNLSFVSIFYQIYFF
jgi:Leucine-rich repeat (LRR) protein